MEYWDLTLSILPQREVYISQYTPIRLAERAEFRRTTAMFLAPHPHPRVTKTLAAWQHCCPEILSVWLILRKFSPKYMLFCCKIHSKFLIVFFCEKNMCCDVANFPPKYMKVCYKYSTKICLFGKMPVKSTSLENFHTNLLC